ncbi:MAG: alcohol dehydrogenase catalytic domain-containing protein [Anaerolineae bacterium]|nr:alcohol dehydrogenase catalytic domain-containing protein [Anaerolineae bacterium]
MRAVVFDRELQVTTVECPVPAPDEALIRLRLAGICNTDLELLAGYKGFSGILGHEFVGEVVQGPSDWVGQRVVGEINISCGTCDMCQRGMPTQCRNRRVLGIMDYGGAFADRFCLAVQNLVAVPESLSDEEAVFTEPLAAACQVLESAHIKPSDRVIVLGAGKLGLLVAQVVRPIGVDLSVIIRHERQSTLLDRWGIPAVRRDAVAEGVADVVIDCTGQASGFADALALVRPRGTVIAKSTYHGLPPADLTQIVVREIQVIGSRCGPFGAALRLLAQGLVDVQSLIDARYSLSEATAAFEHAARHGVLKVLLAP